MSRSSGMTYFHGGVPDLRPGDLIEPQPMGQGRHLVPGCPVCEARRAGTPSDYDRNHRFDRVYVTTDRFVARCFAFGYPEGDVYYVEPLGNLEPDPEHEESFAVRGARVKAVVARRVVPRPAEYRRWAKLAGLTEADLAIASLAWSSR